METAVGLPVPHQNQEPVPHQNICYRTSPLILGGNGLGLWLLRLWSECSGRERGTMLGLDVCEFGGQVLELLWLTMCYRDLMAEKEEKSIGEEGEDEADLNYTPPAIKSLQEIKELDKEDESLNKYKQTLLGAVPIVADPSLPNVQVTRLTLMCEQAPGPITMDLTGSPIHYTSFTLCT
ncbi:Rho GDP-dissociation inhibitor 2 [Merluccius polli]|uniref:Rho GDP-dissociation inhibitor 2 n=1 Tax=Merluccius polli TaxID=89951 RepID=A0AA47M0W6_MERPO|nr:Rho GDP-dissociation inhibitor 2 [Merluccius polli]